MGEHRQCDNCKTEVDAAATFCPRCGQRFAPAATPPPAPPVPPAAPPPAPVAAAPPPPPAAPPVMAAPVPPTPVVPATAPARRSSAWPAVAIGCAVLLVILAVGGFALYRGYQSGRQAWAEVQQELKAAQPKTDTGGEAAKTEDTTTGEQETKTSDEPVIEVGEGGGTNPPTAYPVEEVPALQVEEGKPFGPVSNGDQAAGLVLAKPETQDWVQAIDAARQEGKKRTAMVSVELIPGTGNYLVHLFENVQDEEPGHTATFGWFKVNKETGEVTNETVGAN